MKVAVRLTILIGLGAVAIALWAQHFGFTWADARHLGTPRNVLTIDGEAVRVPLPAGDPQRILPEVPVTTEGSHAFMFPEDPASPDRYDPCRPLTWVLDPEQMPAGADSLVQTAVNEIQAATGLSFAYGGYSATRASFERPLFDEELYGAEFAPIIIGFSDAITTPELAGSVTGLGGSTSVTGAFGDDRFLTSGVVIMDADDVTTLLDTKGGEDLVTAVIMHEIGHVVGLDHVDDETEVMNETNRWLTQWGPGDRQGLAIAGAGPCQST